MDRFQSSSFVISILLICLVPLLIVIYLTYVISERGLKEKVRNELNLVAENKAADIDDFIVQAQNQAKILAYNPIIVAAISKMNALPKSPTESIKLAEIAAAIAPYVSYFMTLNGYGKIYIISTENTHLFSLAEADHFKGDYGDKLSALPELVEVIERAKVLMQTEISNFTSFQGSHQQVAFLAVPVLSKGVVSGVIALQFSQEEISKILNTFSGTSNSLEIIVGFLLPNSDVQLTQSLKFDSSKHLLSQAHAEDRETYGYFVKSTLGSDQKGSIFKDYRGKEVLAVSEYIPSLRWGMITKIDTSEAFHSVAQLRESILWLTGLSLPLLGLMLYGISKKLQHSKELLDNIINSMPFQMLIFNEDAEIILWNNAVKKDGYIQLEDSKGKSIEDIFKHLEPLEKEILASIHSQLQKKIEKITYPTPEGNVYFEALLYPLKGSDFHGTALLIRDITDRVLLMDGIQQQERLASIGILVAGVAHEINNPINFITSNVNSLRKDINDLLEVLNRYTGAMKYLAADPAAFNQAINNAQAFKEELGVDYTIAEIDRLLAGMSEGAERTAAIVKGLHSFARVDDIEMKNANIIEGIESTLTLLRNNYKNRIEIVREYEEVPAIDCYPGKLNQVFMNLINNAIQAIKGHGTIYIKISRLLNTVRISIRDTGSGIKECHKNKIFMPFFTTKDVGQGTGLGLSITYNIVLDHHGTIVVNSEEGKGAEFIVTLPIKQPENKAIHGP